MLLFVSSGEKRILEITTNDNSRIPWSGAVAELLLKFPAIVSRPPLACYLGASENNLETV